MPSTSEIATHYFECVSRQDIPGMVACWKPGSRATFVGMDELNAPEDYDQWFGNLFGCFPDFKLEAQSIVAEGEQASVHWRATGTFNGEGIFEGFRPNGASIDIEGLISSPWRTGRSSTSRPFSTAWTWPASSARYQQRVPSPTRQWPPPSTRRPPRSGS